MQCKLSRRTFLLACVVVLVLLAAEWSTNRSYRSNRNDFIGTLAPSTDALHLDNHLRQVPSSSSQSVANKLEDAESAVNRNDTSVSQVSEGARSDIIWRGGGVKGPTVHEVETYLDELFANFVVTSRVRDDACEAVHAFHSTENRNDGVLKQRTTNSLWQHLEALMRNLTLQGLQRDDCWIHLTPQQRSVCLLVAALDTRSVNAPLRRQLSYMQSYCSTMVPCLQWRRGQFLMTLNATHLEHVYRSEVVPQVVHDEENDLASRLLKENFVHDDSNINDSTGVLATVCERHLVQELEMGKNFVLAEDAFEADAARKKRRPHNRTAQRGEELRWAVSAHDVAPVFQNTKITFDAVRRHVRVATRDTHVEVTLQHFTPLQVLSLLHHKVVASYQRRKRYRNDDAVSDEPTFKPNMNVIVFSGDSMNREFFMRIIHHIRFGRDAPESNEHLRQTPFHEPSQQHDMIYSVFPTYDQLDVYHSQMSNARSSHTVQSFFQRLKWDVRSWERNSSQFAVPPNVALLYLVYYWDPQTDYYRRDLLPSLVALGPTIRRHADYIVNASIIGPRQSLEQQLHLGPVFQAAKRVEAEKRLEENMNPCEVKMWNKNGEARIINFADHRWWNEYHRAMQKHRAMPADGALGLRTSGRSVHDMSRLNECTPERRLAAERARRSMASHFHDRFGAKPVVPLRDFGIKIAVHIQGNVFWEHERNVEMMQHMMATLLATENDVPLDPRLPRRTIPKDQTELYIFTSSFQEDLQPFLRHLSPRYVKRVPHIQVQDADAERVLNGSDAFIGNESAMLDEDVGVDEVLLQATSGDSAVGDMEENHHRHLPSSARRSANATVDWTLRLHRGECPLRKYRMPPETRANLVKNMRLFGWFERVVQKRNELLQSDRTVPLYYVDKDAPGTRSTNPFRYIRHAALLDMGKLQALRFTQGDNRHFSCRYTQVKDRIRFRSSFQHNSLYHILNLGDHTKNANASIFCASRRTEGSSSAPFGYSLYDVMRYLVMLFEPNERREWLWHVTGMENAERQKSLVHYIMHFEDYKEYGVIVHDDDDRCVDEANMFLSEVLFADMVRQDVKEVESYRKVESWKLGFARQPSRL